MNMKLNEVIWEVTLKCNRRCDFCGSSDVIRTNNPVGRNNEKIAYEIADYGVETCVLTGGEPGCLPAEDMNLILKTLRDGGVDVRVITNGLFLDRMKMEDYDRYSDEVSTIGLSVNEPMAGLYERYQEYADRVTIITNFGTHNVWQFDEIAEIAKKFPCWQVQLTMGKPFQLPANGITFLREKIEGLDDDVKYILADNLQDEHDCTAGMNCCGVTADGEVIPCLSARPCGVDLMVQGNLFQRTLKDIWETEFRDIRFGDGYCNTCRKFIDYPSETPLKIDVGKIFMEVATGGDQDDDIRKPWEHPQIQLYGCGDNRVIVYGVGSSWNLRSR